jgi:hypothetical protein
MRGYQNRIDNAVLAALGRIVADNGGDPDNYLIMSWGRCTAMTDQGFRFTGMIVKTKGDLLPLGNLEFSLTIDHAGQS